MAYSRFMFIMQCILQLHSLSHKTDLEATKNHSTYSITSINSKFIMAKGGGNQKAETTPKKAGSPPRKATPLRESNRHAGNLSNANQVKFMNVTIDNVAIGVATKSDGVGPSYLGNILSHIESDAEKMEHCKILFFTKLRNPNGSDEALEVANKQGNKYPFDIAVFATTDEVPIRTAASNYAMTLTEISKTDCKDEWKFGVPMYLYKGDATPAIKPSLNYYLLTEDCVAVMKRIYEGCDFKQQLLTNEFRDTILSEVFGDAAKGLDIIENMADAIYDTI